MERLKPQQKRTVTSRHFFTSSFILLVEETEEEGSQNHEETHGQKDDSLSLIPHVLLLSVGVLVLEELDGL